MPSGLLVCMPFGALDRPALGLSLLTAEAERAGVACDVRYFTFAFAELVGVMEYAWLVNDLPHEALAGEWIFTPALYGPRPAQDAGYVREILRGRFSLGEAEVSRVMRARAYVEPFLDHCVSAVRWADHDLVGFTSTFQQNIASLALAQRVKAAHPQVAIAFGGANWEGEMGEALHRRFEFVDVACSGEADESFPRLLNTLADGASPAAIPGIVYRAAGRTVATPPKPVEDLDSLPMPDFGAYFRDLDASPCRFDISPRLLVETARGCWWGAHSHCTFCGLNGSTMAFRSKSPERAISEIRALTEWYGVGTVSVVDNILDLRYVRTVLPALADGPPLDLFWEVKANLSRQQVRALADAGVRHVQPGIESMSNHVLELLRKGTTMHRNVQLLKWAREYGVGVEWNLLFGAPGENPGDVATQVRLFRSIGFLDPPGACGPIRLDRFSPYHADPASFGLCNVRALAPYRFLYDVGPPELDRIAYHFEFDYADDHDPFAAIEPCLRAVERWRAERAAGGGVWAFDRPDESLTILDDRPGRPRRSSTLNGWKATIFRACDRARTLPEITGLDGVADTAAPDQVLTFLDRCCTTEVMVADGQRWQALAVYVPPRRAPEPHVRTRRPIPVAVAVD